MEKLMQYVWNTRLWGRGTLEGCHGEHVEVLNPGRPNTLAGPDFLDARVRINGTVWVGNIELHLDSGLWYTHGHHHDPAYNNVVLHVVGRHQGPVVTASGRQPCQVVMGAFEYYASAYRNLLAGPAGAVPCAMSLPRLGRLSVTSWLSALGHESLQAKAAVIRGMLESTGGDWATTVYLTLARGMGMGTNAQAMETLARQTPLAALEAHADSDLQTTALLLQQASLLTPALLPPEAADAHATALCTEGRFLQLKYGLTPISPLAWRMGGVRPASSPWRRVAMLAALLRRGFAHWHTVAAMPAHALAQQLAAVAINPYWCNHHRPGMQTRATIAPTLPQGTANHLLINVYAPLMYAYGMLCGSEPWGSRAVDLWENLPPEASARVALFARGGLKPRNALESQALLHLFNTYCARRRCLECRFAHGALATNP